MHADRELAIAAAVCDAVARAGWPGSEAVARLRAEGAAVRHEAERARAAILARTRVDFSELGQED
jgi:alpha-D-ribose 1-methylphosphonate 5-triphosphate synthase subunit PhnG